MTITHRIATFIATGFGLGYIAPIGQGTIGAAAAMLAAPWFLSRSLVEQLVIAIIISVIGVWSSSVAEGIFQKKDDHRIIIDEMASVFVMFIGFGALAWPLLVIAFFLNRAVDIWKPGPIHSLQSLRGGWGVVVDDLAVGIVVNVLLRFLVIVV